MRLNPEDIWFKYSSRKQTYQELAEEFGCSVRTIQRHIQKARKAEPKTEYGISLYLPRICYIKHTKDNESFRVIF